MSAHLWERTLTTAYISNPHAVVLGPSAVDRVPTIAMLLRRAHLHRIPTLALQPAGSDAALPGPRVTGTSDTTRLVHALALELYERKEFLYRTRSSRRDLDALIVAVDDIPELVRQKDSENNCPAVPVKAPQTIGLADLCAEVHDWGASVRMVVVVGASDIASVPTSTSESWATGHGGYGFAVRIALPGTAPSDAATLRLHQPPVPDSAGWSAPTADTDVATISVVPLRVHSSELAAVLHDLGHPVDIVRDIDIPTDGGSAASGE